MKISLMILSAKLAIINNLNYLRSFDRSNRMLLIEQEFSYSNNIIHYH